MCCFLTLILNSLFSRSPKISYLILTTDSQGPCHYCHFTAKKTKIYRVKVTLISEGIPDFIYLFSSFERKDNLTLYDPSFTGLAMAPGHFFFLSKREEDSEMEWF